MTKYLHILFFTCCWALFVIPARAESLLVGISTGYPPYYYTENGKLTGFCVELVEAVAQRIGMAVEFRPFPWKRLIMSGENGTIDAVMPLFKTAEREKFLFFEGLALAYETNQFFTAKDSTIVYEGTLDAIKPYRIGTVEEYSYGENFDKTEFPNKILSKDDQHLFKLLVHNRIDIGVGSRSVIQYYADLSGEADQIRFLTPPITKEILYIGFSKNRVNGELPKNFANALKEFKTSPRYSLLLDKYHITGE